MSPTASAANKTANVGLALAACAGKIASASARGNGRLGLPKNAGTGVSTYSMHTGA